MNNKNYNYSNDKTNIFTNLFKRLLNKLEHFWFMKIKNDSISYSKKLGVRLGDDCQVIGDPLITFETEPWLIKMGDHVDITPGVKFVTHEGRIWCARGIDPKYEKLDTFLPIIIGNNVIIGLDSIIMSGVKIGNNVIIAAHSVVTKDVSDNTIVAGVPSKAISTMDKFLEKFSKREFFPTKKMSALEKKLIYRKSILNGFINNMKKTKIAILISHMKDGGAQRIVLNNLLDLYNDSSLDLRLFVFDMKNNYWCEQIIDINRFNTYYLYPSKKINTNNFVNKIVYRIKFIRELKRFAPDIIHGHITPLIRSAILPIISSKPNYVFFTLHSNPFRVKGMDKCWAKFGFNKLGIIPVCLNEEQAKMAQQHYGFKHYEILHNGVDFEKIRNNIISKEEARKLFNIDVNSFVLCACGRLDKVKNYPLMLDIFKKVLEKKTNAVLLIAGEGSEKEFLINYTKKLGIKENVRFLGNLDNPIPLYCSANVFLLTSHSESMSLVLMEAQACGCKCVISSGVPKESIITNNVVSMRENATLEEWTNDILTDNCSFEKPRFTEADYEVHAMSQKCKEMYLRYLNGEKDE